ncbi:MAG: response regulator transcription factor [Candidatus Cloacimonetes bacterium]|nr:response regulator transcription factor [Candidatus Cloacimonadota bacterium]
MKKQIFILDDEQDILELVALHLSKSGFDPVSFSHVADFWKALETTIPNLIILDLMLPDTDGMEICKKIRKQSESIPIIMLTAKDDEMEKILGLELGADDYITKPFSPRELVARVKAVLRRSSIVNAVENIGISDLLRMDINTYEVWVKERKIELTSTEFKLLKLFIEKQGWVFSREKILDYLWGKEKAVIDRTVDVHVKNLREKLGEAGKLIKNVRGVGYKLEIT